MEPRFPHLPSMLQPGRLRKENDEEEKENEKEEAEDPIAPIDRSLQAAWLAKNTANRAVRETAGGGLRKKERRQSVIKAVADALKGTTDDNGRSLRPFAKEMAPAAATLSLQQAKESEKSEGGFTFNSNSNSNRNEEPPSGGAGRGRTARRTARRRRSTRRHRTKQNRY